MTRNPDQRREKNAKPGVELSKNWENILQKILAAFMVAALIFVAEKLLIQIISIGYHRTQFTNKIKDSKRNVHLLSLLYDASRTLFPAYCNEFAEEDYIINDSIDLGLGSSKKAISHNRSGSATPMRLIQNVGRIGDKITSAFGNIASEVTGKQVFNPGSAHSVVVEALEKNKSSEALAKRLWMSFVVEGKDALYQEDIEEVLGHDRVQEAEECFSALDRDGNGDISLDEMVLTVCEIGRERHSIANSLHDVDQAINVLDSLLCTIVFVMVIFVFSKFLHTDLHSSRLIGCSRLPQQLLHDHAGDSGYCTAFPLLCLQWHGPGSPGFLHLPLRQASLRCARPRRHRHRAACRGTHLPALHRVPQSKFQQARADP